MKINRYRKVNRTLKFYSNHFGFRKPYQVLLDGTVCVAALKNKINIYEQFTKYLDGDVKLLTTQCIVKEVEKLGRSTSGALYVLKNFGHHQCGHDDSPVSAPDCILHMIGNKNNSRYIIATQDRKLQQKCRSLVGVPLLYFHMRMPTLEAPSPATQNVITCKSQDDVHVTEADRDRVLKLTEGNEIAKPVKRKKKFAKGPNPLSCKKKKPKLENNLSSNVNSNQKKKKKKKKKQSLLGKES